MEEIRQRLESTRRRQNISLGLAHLGFWLCACALLFAGLAAVGALFDVSTTTWRWLFAVFALGVFAITFVLAWHFLVRWQSSRHFAHSIEERLPELEQRLITSVEFENVQGAGVSPQFVQRLFEDAHARVSARPLATAVSLRPAQRALGFACVALLSLGVLMFVSETFQQASRQLTLSWRGGDSQLEPAGLPVALHVEPGSISMQRGDDLKVIASLDNAGSDQLVLYVQDDNVNWQRLSMAPESGQPETNAKTFETRIGQLSDDLIYYVEYRSGSGENAEVVRSPQYRVTLFDLPRVDALELVYDFPDYTGLEDKVDNPGGDVVAPQGTTIAVNATLNKAVKEARLVFTDGESLPLTIDDGQVNGSFQVDEDTHYRIELIDLDNNPNKNPAEHYVRAIEDREPNIALRAPGRDQQVMPLEEIPIQVNAKDDYGLEQFELVYSVVGGEEKTVNFLDAAQDRKTVSGHTMVYLEDLAVQPGDVVSYSITARDNNGFSGPVQVVSDIYFLEVIPTDHEFSRARGGGGGGGGDSDASALVKTQKEVIAATWKLRNRQGKTDDESIQEDGRIIRDSQAEVAQRAQMSINRLTERGTFSDDNYQRAVEALQKAIREMESAVQNLEELALPTALQSEQSALQALLQAEAQVNKSQVAMNRSGGGGGGGQGGEREDLRELFEMEMGELENRYELPQQQAGQRSGAQNETLDKLKELARRQERLTRSQRELARRENQMDEEQKRRQLEQLRREQEELRQQLSQLADSMQQQSSSQPQTGQQQSQSQSSRSSGQGGSRSEREQMDQLQQAMQQMQEAAQTESAGQAAAKSQKALDTLRRQAEEMNEQGQQSVAELQKQVKERAEQLVRNQRELRRAVEEKSRSESLSNTRSQTASSGATEELQQQQAQLREDMNQLGRDLRDIAANAGDDQQRAMQEAHDLSRALRPIQEKMDTSKQILQRGMLNLSLKIENDIEAELADLQRHIQSMGNGPGGSGGDQDSEQVAQQVRQLRESLEQLQQQVEQQQPEQLASRRGERSGAGDADAEQNSDAQDRPAGRGEMQDSLRRSRELAQGLAQLGLGGQPWAGNARSIRSQLTQQNLEEFLSRPELLEQLLTPVVELEKQLRVQAELREIDNKLYSALEDEVPEQYKALVERYYKVLSESRSVESR
jgi:hypothetical protein